MSKKAIIEMVGYRKVLETILKNNTFSPVERLDKLVYRLPDIPIKSNPEED